MEVTHTDKMQNLHKFPFCICSNTLKMPIINVDYLGDSHLCI